jgi:hypothetical protein
MKLINFDLEKYNSGNYNTVLGNGSPVTIGAINPEQDFAILGWANGYSFAWHMGGIYDATSTDNTFTLYLTPKKTTVHITVTRTKEGKINVYGTPDRVPAVYNGAELLKRLTVEID